MGGNGNPPAPLAAQADPGEFEAFVPVSVALPAETALPGRDLPVRAGLAVPVFDIATSLAFASVVVPHALVAFPSPGPLVAETSTPGDVPEVPAPIPVVPVIPPPNEVPAVEVAFPSAAAVAGVFGLNLDRLEGGVRDLLTRVADIGLPGLDEVGHAGWYTWLAVGGLLAGGAGYAAWAERTVRRSGRIAAGAGSVTIRWGNHDIRLR